MQPVRALGVDAAEIPTNADNLILRVANRVAVERNRDLPPFRMTIANEIPLARGLGSSAAAIIAGITCYELVTQDRLSEADIFRYAFEFETHPDNLSQKFFDAIVENARKIIDDVKPRRTKFTYEAMGWSLPDNPDNYVKLIKAIDRPAFGVHLDPCNMVNCPEKFYGNTALLNECFDKLGQWVVSCHAKDLAWETEMNVHFKEVIPGKGSLDHATYLRRLAKLPQNPPLMLEHLTTAESYTEAREHVFKVGSQAGLSFE